MRIAGRLGSTGSFLLIMGCLAVLALARPVHASTIFTCTTPIGAISCTGALGTPEDVFTEVFTISGAPQNITIQTYGFGGGTNAAGTLIAAGGFDSLVALFSGTATAATILANGGNPISSADNSTQFFAGCPPAGTVTVGMVTGLCGDSTLSATLSAGTYTLLLADANFVPLAVNPFTFFGPYDLTDTTSMNYGSSTDNGAYNDLTSGVFRTCATEVDCNTDTSNFAVDITGLESAPASVPEPGTLILALAGLVSLARVTKPLSNERLMSGNLRKETQK